MSDDPRPDSVSTSFRREVFKLNVRKMHNVNCKVISSTLSDKRTNITNPFLQINTPKFNFLMTITKTSPFESNVTYWSALTSEALGQWSAPCRPSWHASKRRGRGTSTPSRSRRRRRCEHQRGIDRCLAARLTERRPDLWREKYRVELIDHEKNPSLTKMLNLQGLQVVRTAWPTMWGVIQITNDTLDVEQLNVS